MTYTPLPKSVELIDAINDMIVSGVNNEKLTTIRDAADKLESTGNFVDAKRVKGMLAALAWDIADVHSQFEAALKAGGRDVLTCVNYAAALGNIGDVLGAIQMIDEAVEQAPDNQHVIKQAISFHFGAFDVDGTKALIEHLNKLGASWGGLDGLADMDQFLSLSGCNWQDLAKRISFASTKLSEHGLSPRGHNFAEHDGAILFRFKIHAPGGIEHAATAEADLLAAIADLPYSNVDKHLYLSCEAV